MMIILLLACGSPSDSSDNSETIRIFQGDCDYVEFPEQIQVDPGASYLVTICNPPDKDGYVYCAPTGYRVDAVGMLAPTGVCPEGGTWEIAEIRGE